MVDASEWNGLFGTGSSVEPKADVQREFGDCPRCGKTNAVLVDGVCGECYVKHREVFA